MLCLAFHEKSSLGQSGSFFEANIGSYGVKTGSSQVFHCKFAADAATMSKKIFNDDFLHPEIERYFSVCRTRISTE